MLLVVCYALFFVLVRCPWFLDCCMRFVRCSLFVACCGLLVARWFDGWYLMCLVCVSFVGCCLLFGLCPLIVVMWSLLFVFSLGSIMSSLCVLCVLCVVLCVISYGLLVACYLLFCRL